MRPLEYTLTNDTLFKMLFVRHVDLEVQVKDEHDYPERSLYYWARDFSSARTIN